MSQSYPPPQPPQGGNPYGQQPPQYGVPPQGGNPFGQQPQQPGGFGGGYPPPAPLPPARDNVGLGILVGFGAMLVVALAYGGILRALAKDDGSTYEIRYVALGVGLLVGFLVGKTGGRNVLLPFFSIVFALLAVFLGEIFGSALIASHYVSQQGGDLSLTEIFFHHFGDLVDGWKHDFDFKRAIVLIFAGVAAFGVTKRVGD
ncbi:hypothetical protein [Streptomyces sp. RKAG293]|uniref:hypothetical protein n=1 Tax=Streptomyces sp. RKAG293 TaxID=2893403 RepID=UPI0020344CC6|nr:hypothetical protein [Streptomyces sp. RKAG293]MCM2421118.1 hypothetical protein [Streptomyces sp. RKAG293]